MDARKFDRLARALGATASRRGVLAGVLAGLLAAARPGVDAESKRRRRGGTERRRTEEGRKRAKGAPKGSTAQVSAALPTVPAQCCADRPCAPGPGKDLSKCCFDGQRLDQVNFRGTNASRASFRNAVLTGADFRGASLNRACFVGADIRGAKFGGANRDGAVYCRTLTDAGIDNSGCGRGTTCCPTGLGGTDPYSCQTAADCPTLFACATPYCDNGRCDYSLLTAGRDPTGLCPTSDSGDPGYCCQGTCCPRNANTCTPSGQCCTVNCAATAQCGPNGCGGVCPPGCPPGQACSADGTRCICVPAGGSCDNGSGGGNPLACCSNACECPIGQPCVCLRG